MVSLGDSYSSGEGIEPFYDQDKKAKEKVKSPDWLAHRSTKSWPGRLKLQGMTMSDYKGENWFFAAASGATTYNLNNTQSVNLNYIPLGGLGLVKYTKAPDLDPQLDVIRSLRASGKKIDYVTITIGGNDADFEGILFAAAIGNRYIFPNWLENKIDGVGGVWDRWRYEIRDNLLQAYKDIEEAAGKDAKIIVAGYPGLINQEGSKGVFDEYEVQYIDHQVELFNEEIEKLVNECHSEGMNIYFAPVIGKFYEHEAYTDDPYINRVTYGANFEDINTLTPVSAYSMHPNDKGAAKYAEAVQEVIDKLEKSGSSGFQSVDVSALPSGLTDFLHQFQTFYRDGKGGKEYNYQTASTDGSNVMASIMGEGGIVNLEWYSVPYPQRYDQTYYFKDFTVNAYYEYDGPGIDWIAKNIFNLSAEDIRLLNNLGYENSLYKIDDNAEGDFDYYAPIPDGVGDPFTVVNILEAKKSGNKYQITYEVRGDGSLHSDLVGTYSAELEYKDIDGKSYDCPDKRYVL